MSDLPFWQILQAHHLAMDTNRCALPSAFVACSAVPDLDDFPKVPHIQPEIASEVLYFKRNSRNIWLPEYREEILDHLLATETKRVRFSPAFEAPARRPQMLRMMKKWAIAYSMPRTTFHLAVYVLDHYIDGLRLDGEDTVLIMMTSLLLAAKADDVGFTRFQDLNKYLGLGYGLKDYCAAEKRIVRKFRFDFCRPTMATFAEIFACDILSEVEFDQYKATAMSGHAVFQPTTAISMFHLSICYSSFDEMVKSMVTFALRLTDLCLFDLVLCDVAPSIMAAACIMTTRRMQFLEDWSHQLALRTRLEEYMIEAFVCAITNLYESEMSYQRECEAGQQGEFKMDTTASEAGEVAGPTADKAAAQCIPYMDDHRGPGGYHAASPERFQATSLFTGVRVTGLTQKQDAPAQLSPNYQITTLLSHDLNAAGGNFQPLRQAADKANTGLFYPDAVLLAESGHITSMDNRDHELSWLDTLDSTGNTDTDVTHGSVSNPRDTNQEYSRCPGIIAAGSSAPAEPDNSLFAKEFQDLSPDLRILLCNDPIDNSVLRNSLLMLKTCKDESLGNPSALPNLCELESNCNIFGADAIAPCGPGRYTSTDPATGVGCTAKFPLRLGGKSKPCQYETHFEGKKIRKK